MKKLAVLLGYLVLAGFYGCPAVVGLLNERLSRIANIAGLGLAVGMLVIGAYVVSWALSPGEQEQI